MNETAAGAAPYRTPTDRDPTPDLDAFIAAYEDDDNEWWAIACGHHQNLFEAAVERIRELEQALSAREFGEVGS